MALPGEVDIAIIGAGAAGLAAARRLENANLSLLIIEGRNRIGGRAHTVMAGRDCLGHAIHFDLGCGWLHSADRNAFVGIAEDLGIALDKSTPPWRKQTFDIEFSKGDQQAFQEAIAAFYRRAADLARTPRDEPASTALEDGGRWNALIDAVSSYINATELANVSLRDVDAYEDTGINWRAPQGYGALIAAFGASCPVLLDTRVKLIDHTGPRLRISTSRGDIGARAVIVTVPTNMMASEELRFHPSLPEKVEVAAHLPLGAANKVILAFDEPDALPADGHLYGATNRVSAGTYHLRPFGRAAIEGYFGGAFARDLENEGKGALSAQACDELVALLGADMRRKLRPLAESRWVNDPFAQGAWSYAAPGHADARAKLASPVQGRIFFAGEATSPNFFSTAHGAHGTGIRAAEEVLDIFGST